MFLTIICQGNELSFLVKSNRLFFLCCEIPMQRLVFVSGCFQKMDAVPRCIKIMPIHHLLAMVAVQMKVRPDWHGSLFTSSPVELVPG